MKIVDRYLIFTVIKSTLFVLFALCALHLVFAFRGQADDINNDYTALKALSYVILLLPQSVSILLPIAALLGVLLGIGGMASSNELTVLRAAGVRPARIAWSLVVAGLGLSICGAIVHDQIAPRLAEQAYELRSTARAGGAQLNGQVWLRHNNQFIYIRSLPASTELVGVQIYGAANDSIKNTTSAVTNPTSSAQPEINSDNLNRIAKASRARFENGNWTLFNYAESVWKNGQINTFQAEQKIALAGLKPELLELFALNTNALNLLGLYDYASYLRNNNIKADAYELAFWQRIARPFSVLVMVLLPLPLLFGSMRSMGAGQRTVIGVAIGIVFFVANEWLSNAGQIFGFSPILAAWLPTVVFAVLAMLGISRIR